MFKRVSLIVMLSIGFSLTTSSTFIEAFASQETEKAAAFLAQGLALYSQGKYKEAIEPLTQAIRLNGGIAAVNNRIDRSRASKLRIIP